MADNPVSWLENYVQNMARAMRGFIALLADIEGNLVGGHSLQQASSCGAKAESFTCLHSLC